MSEKDMCMCILLVEALLCFDAQIDAQIDGQGGFVHVCFVGS